MDIRDQIREAIKSRNGRLNSTWSQDREPHIYEVDKFLRKSGYKLSNIEVHHINGKSLPELIIEPMSPGYLYPDVSHMVAEGKYYIDVKKYGEMEISDVKGIIKGYENAIAVVSYLETVNLNSLEFEGSEDEE